MQCVPVDARNSALVDEAVAFAEQSPLPEAWELTTDVYVPAGPEAGL